MEDIQPSVDPVDLGVRCEQCETWFVVHIQRGRLVDTHESICPKCGGAAFLMTPDGQIEGAPLKK